MAVPGYQGFMRPLLALLADGQEWRFQDICTALADQFDLSAEDRAELLPSGKQAVYLNRIGWAKTYLVKAAALHSPRRSVTQITERGLELLREHPQHIRASDLTRFQVFAAFQGSGSGDMERQPTGAADTPSPEEQLELLAERLNAALKAELLAHTAQLSPAQFEQLVVDVLVALGYGGSARDAGRALGGTGDNGIDGVINQDPLGLDRVYIQAKRWQHNVGSPEIRNFAGSLTYHRAIKGVLITTSGFSESALATAQQIGNIVLIDGSRLAELMMKVGVGVTTRRTVPIYRLNSEYFEEL